MLCFPLRDFITRFIHENLLGKVFLLTHLTRLDCHEGCVDSFVKPIFGLIPLLKYDHFFYFSQNHHHLICKDQWASHCFNGGNQRSMLK